MLKHGWHLNTASHPLWAWLLLDSYTLWVFVVRCGDSDRVAILFLKDCVPFLFMCQWSWRGSCFGKSNIHIGEEAFSVCFFHLLQTKGAVFAEGGYGSVALALFRLLLTCLHLE